MCRCRSLFRLAADLSVILAGHLACASMPARLARDLTRCEHGVARADFSCDDTYCQPLQFLFYISSVIARRS